MKSSLIPLVIILSCFLGFSSCDKQENTNTSETKAYDYILNNDEVKALLKNNTQSDKTVKVCSPVYVMHFDAEKMSVCQLDYCPHDVVIFPVLEDKKIIGFLMYQYAEGICGMPRFMPISDEAYNKLKKKHALKIAYARWKHGGYHMDFVYLSDDNETDCLFDFDFPETLREIPHIQFEYDELTELQGFDLKSLEVIMTFENQ